MIYGVSYTENEIIFWKLPEDIYYILPLICDFPNECELLVAGPYPWLDVT